MALSNYVFGNSAADPFFTEMDRAVNRMINNALGVAPTSAGKAGHTHAPMDIIESPTAFELHADAPGMGPDDVKVELQEGVLMVTGERKLSHTTKEAGGKVWRSERTAYSFSRAFSLPENANPDGITAAMDKGVLVVTVPKREPPAKPEPKRIAVTGA
ncbi:hypothetical protein CHLRE_07g318800v5 [Chlamydomonas reinhardtii]|uniref:Heat shock 22 kDa protein, chloroplastic n=2 Tax=Chlamydomonas reinhardtii TaxID=3055 RepID=HS22C_CHLRE|nr:uncharacterized protein CHLRE_07g318800v5 [Chlamydomonas reinhardtii]P12811.1 RecName: Full=Heat shock 22 kDa protein, chloroplastic [Chlamydomonas reinhardtii]PNW80468.1 hypothetical protein CHLRE_07g318800v5 [Chlamydomonas reinhardtii]CAA33152.1 unnamed protein product [Chlamydomonas reinhardtii]|eukprot:XP_001701015.1 heat shock protein 22A [Chlamydomonas reinhardtii]